MIKTQVPAILELVGLSKKIDNFPNELSGGEQQRVSIARAFVNRPLILLADEPTGNLDPATSVGIMRLLDRINRTGTTVVMATHDQSIVDTMRRRVIELDHGLIVRDQSKGVYGPDHGAEARLLRARDGCEPSSQLLAHDRVPAHGRGSLACVGVGPAPPSGRRQCNDSLAGRHRVHRLPAARRDSRPGRRGGPRLKANPDVKDVKFVDKQQAYEEFKLLFRNSPELVDTVTPDILPASWRVVPSNTDPNVIEAIGRQFEKKAGVMSVVFAKDTVESVMKVTRLMQIGILGAAVVLLIAACLLIVNTIRTAMLRRRREIEVMKLVGASNWFIRVPFMLEGLVQGLLGAALACVAVRVLNSLVESRVTEGQSLAILQNFSVSASEVNGTLLLLLLVGGLVGAIGSGVAVSSYLDV